MSSIIPLLRQGHDAELWFLWLLQKDFSFLSPVSKLPTYKMGEYMGRSKARTHLTFLLLSWSFATLVTGRYSC
jgi:hypothetical protein